MRNYIRHRQPGACYFFTVVTHQRRPILTEFIDELRTAVRYVKQHHPFTIDGIVILPDHIHTIWQLPESDDNYPMRCAQIKRRFSMSIRPDEVVDKSRRVKHERGLWQRRYWEHLIRDAEDWRRHMDYLHYNPVKHGYVQNPIDWPYSSLATCQHNGWYESGWGSEVDENILKMELE